MPASKYTLVQEVESGYYRILESFHSSDGWRSRICDWRDLDLGRSTAEVTRRLERRDK